MSAQLCDQDRAAALERDLADTRRTLEEYRRDLERVTKDLDALKDRLRRGFGQVVDGDKSRDSGRKSLHRKP